MMEFVGLPLSLVAIAIFIALLLDWRRRRGRFEPVHVAGHRFDAGAAQWVWLAVLVGSFAATIWSPGVVLSTHDQPVVEAQAGPAGESPALGRTGQWYRVAAVLPFYRYDRTVRSTDGAVQSVTISRQLVLPLWLLIGFALYWRFVIRRDRTADAVAPGEAVGWRPPAS